MPNNEIVTISRLLEMFLQNGELDSGLYYGEVGVMLLYSISTGRNDFLFERVIDKAGSNIKAIEDYSFSKGLTGIGWGLQIMLETERISPKHSILLSSLDDLVYQKVANSKSRTLSLFSPMSALAKALYFYQRIISKKYIQSDLYRDLAHKECLILLTTEIKELLSVVTDSKNELISKRSGSLLEIGQSFILLNRLLVDKINKEYVRGILIDLREFIQEYFESKPDVKFDNAHNILYLLYAYTLVSFENRELKMKSNSVAWAKAILPQILPWLKSRTDKCILDKIVALCGTRIYYSCSLSDDIKSFSLWEFLGPCLRSDQVHDRKEVTLLRAFMLE